MLIMQQLSQSLMRSHRFPGGVGSVTTSVLVGHVVEAAIEKRSNNSNKELIIYICTDSKLFLFTDDGTCRFLRSERLQVFWQRKRIILWRVRFQKPSVIWRVIQRVLWMIPQIILYGYYTIMGCTTVDAEDMGRSMKQNVEYPSGS